MHKQRDARPLQIGELAAGLGLNPRTIRYYEQIGLLPAPQRSEGGFRLYGEADRERLRFIIKARTVGLSLAEIGEILALRDRGEPPCGHVLELLDHKLEAVDRQLRALAEFRQQLATLRQEAAMNMATDACVCGIIEQYQPRDPETPAVPRRGVRTKRFPRTKRELYST